MKISFSMIVLVVSLLGCTEDPASSTTSFRESGKNVQREGHLSFHVTGMKKAASGAI